MIKKQFIWVVGISLMAMLMSAALLGAVFGPTDDGLRCTRTQNDAECEIRQTRFFGLLANSSFAIPESEIRGAKSFCPAAKVGGRGGASCNVYLVLNSGKNYPVLSYAIYSQADSSARRLNDYFQNRTAQSVEIGEDLLTPILLFGIAPLLFVLLVVALRTLKLRTGATSVPKNTCP
ncbi:MAG: hypothetical protein ACRD2U_17420 [Terriglobales bacterium]